MLVLVLGQTAPAASSPTIIRTLVVPLTWGPTPQSPAQIQELVFGQVSSFLERNSFGVIALAGEVTPWLRAANAECGQLNEQSETQWQAILRAAGYEPSAYDRLIYLVPDNGHPHCRRGGADLASAPRQVALFGLIEAGPIEHELGHTFGLMHAGYWGGCHGRATSVAYLLCLIEGDPYDVMAHSGRTGAYNAREKAAAGWVTGITRITRDGDYVVDQLEQRSDLPQALVIDTARNEYWLDHREALGDDTYLYDSPVTEGVMIHGGANPLDHGGPRTTFSNPVIQPLFKTPSQITNFLVASPTGGPDAVRVGESWGERGAFRLTVLAHEGTKIAVRFAWTDRTRPSAPRVKLRPGRSSDTLVWSHPRELSSGIDHYLVRIGETREIVVPIAARRALSVPAHANGRIGVRAVDRAGNRGPIEFAKRVRTSGGRS